MGGGRPEIDRTRRATILREPAVEKRHRSLRRSGERELNVRGRGSPVEILKFRNSEVPDAPNCRAVARSADRFSH